MDPSIVISINNDESYIESESELDHESQCLINKPTPPEKTTAWTFPIFKKQTRSQSQSQSKTTKPNICTPLLETRRNINKNNNNNNNSNDYTTTSSSSSSSNSESESESELSASAVSLNSTVAATTTTTTTNNGESKIRLFFKKMLSYYIYIINKIIRFKLLTWIKIAILICMVTFICVAVFKYKVQDNLKDYLAKLQDFVNGDSHGLLFGGLIYMGAFMLLIIFLIPVTIPTVIGGIIFGFWYALLFVWCASMIGGTISFLIGRFLLRESISKLIAKSKKMVAVDQAVAQESFKLVLLLRFTPIVPESILNYALSVAKISLARYLICSAIGLLPGTSFFIYCGSVVGSIAKFEKEGLGLGKKQIIVYVVSGFLMVVNMVIIGIVVKRAVAKKLKQQEDANEKLLDPDNNNKDDVENLEKDNNNSSNDIEKANSISEDNEKQQTIFSKIKKILSKI